LKSILTRLDAPAYVLPGNVDDRGRLREHFRLPGESAAPLDYAVDLGPARLVVLDTTKPGHDGGELEPGQLDWLDAELAAAPHPVTVLAMHHPPFATGAPAWDAIGLVPADRAALAAVIGRHSHVRRIIAGHVHRAITAEVAGRVALTIPSTYVQARLDFDATRLAFARDPAGFGVHAVRGRDIVSHIQPVTSDAR
jgi:Icc protein